MFCLCPKSLSEAEFECNGLIKLMGGILRRHSIYSVALNVALLLLTKFILRIESIKSQTERFEKCAV